MPMMDNNVQVGPISFPNTRVRKMTDNINTLVDVFIDNDMDTQNLKTALHHYKGAMELARQKEDFTNEEIENFQDYCDQMSNYG